MPSFPPASPLTLLQGLARQLSHQPDALALRFLVTGELSGPIIEWSRAHFSARVSALAGTLRSLGVGPGDRVMLLFDGGPDFIASLYACFFVGAVGVPTYPPDPGRIHRTLPRLQAIAGDAGASVILTTGALLDESEPVCAHADGLRHLRWVAADRVPDAAAVLAPPDLPGDHPAYFQYTSGSTGTPRGVVVTHHNLAMCCFDIVTRWPYSPASHQLTWLPTFHDLGLIWGLMMPLTYGIPVTFMLPTTFLQRPLRWLQALTHYRATMTASPTFGYALCAARIRDEELVGLDLSHLEAAMSGAEPVRVDTLRAFERRFAAVGYRPEIMCPWYGLAEATLQTSVTRPADGPPTCLPVDRASLARGEVQVLTHEGEGSAVLVGCGRVAPWLEMVTVDPQTRRRCPPERVGELWVRGPVVARGYWGRPEETEQTFHAHIEGEQGDWLRTGDLGFFYEGEVFIAGRIKDVIIVRGRNLYPTDLEVAVEGVHRAIRPGCAAAFPVEGGAPGA